MAAHSCRSRLWRIHLRFIGRQRSLIDRTPRVGPGPSMWRTRSSGRVHSFRPRRDWSARSADDALLLYGSRWRGRSRLSRLGPSLLLFGAIALVIWSPSGPPASTISDVVRIIDGYTLEMQGERVRFLDIDAPETSQTCRRSDDVVVPCGQLATAALTGSSARDWSEARVRTASLVPFDRLQAQKFLRWIVTKKRAIRFHETSVRFIEGDPAT